MSFGDHIAGRAVTPEHVLSAIQDMHRQQCCFDGMADPAAKLTFESTVGDWFTACDLVDWRSLSKFLDEEWELGYTDAEWREVLEPDDQRTLRDVCAFIAARAVLPDVASITILGRKCKPAGSFLAIRSALRKAGADVSDVSPSTLIAEYARRYPAVFLGPVSRLAPGALPPVTIAGNPGYDFFLWGVIMSLVLFSVLFFLASFWPSARPLAILAAVLFAVFHFGHRKAAKRLPTDVRFGELQTFRDLAEVIAANTPDVVAGKAD